MKKIINIISIILSAGAFIIIIIAGSTTHKSYETISSEKAFKMMNDDVIILDVREKEEYNNGHIKNALNIPLDNIISEEIDIDKNKTILVYCQSGNRSKTASSKLASLGYENIYNFGGINDWPYEVVK